ncbi:MAG: hypothetical protein VX416_04010, partial [Pseudomonadota bacterium]|nr:hypothetical protein [Pseudomonadota bacterium]
VKAWPGNSAHKVCSLAQAKGVPFQKRLREGMGLHICDGTKQIRKIIIYRRKLAKVQIRA